MSGACGAMMPRRFFPQKTIAFLVFGTMVKTMRTVSDGGGGRRRVRGRARPARARRRRRTRRRARTAPARTPPEPATIAAPGHRAATRRNSCLLRPCRRSGARAAAGRAGTCSRARGRSRGSASCASPLMFALEHVDRQRRIELVEVAARRDAHLVDGVLPEELAREAHRLVARRPSCGGACRMNE